MPHMTMPFTGERYSLIYFCCGNWASCPAEDRATLAGYGFRFPDRASAHAGPAPLADDRAFARHAFPTPRKAYEYDYGFQIHEDHVIQAALLNYKAWLARFAVDATKPTDAALDAAVARQRAGPGEASRVVPGLVLGATARLAWDCFKGESPRNMARSVVGWRHLKHPLGGCVCYEELDPRDGAPRFGVFYDDGDFEELDLPGLAGRLAPVPYAVYVGVADDHRRVTKYAHPTLASKNAAVDAPALARAALAALPPGDRSAAPAADRQLAGKVRQPGGDNNPKRVTTEFGGAHMAAVGLLPRAPRAAPDPWASPECEK